jgi:hypothetical protein
MYYELNVLILLTSLTDDHTLAQPLAKSVEQQGVFSMRNVTKFMIRVSTKTKAKIQQSGFQSPPYGPFTHKSNYKLCWCIM